VLAVRGREGQRNQSLETEEKGRVKEDVQSQRTKISFVGIARKIFM
jgi:hypothetical protein